MSRRSEWTSKSTGDRPEMAKRTVRRNRPATKRSPRTKRPAPIAQQRAVDEVEAAPDRVRDERPGCARSHRRREGLAATRGHQARRSRLVPVDRARRSGHRRRVPGLRILRPRSGDLRRPRREPGNARLRQPHEDPRPISRGIADRRLRPTEGAARVHRDRHGFRMGHRHARSPASSAASLGLFAVLMLNGASTASVHAVHRPLLFDSYPPEIRVRLNSAYRIGDGVGEHHRAAPRRRCCTGILGLTWRGVFLVLAVVSLLVAAISAAFARSGLRTLGHRTGPPVGTRSLGRRSGARRKRCRSASSRSSGACFSSRPSGAS